MKAAIRKGLLGFSYAISNDQSQPKFDATSKKNQNDVLVKVNAAAINPIDYKMPKFAVGTVLGLDFCGTITEIGKNVNNLESGTQLQVGDVVFGNTSQGALAEYTVTSSAKIAKAPKGWKATECAALPVAYQSAMQCLKKGKIADATDVDKKTVLIFGASGGCGIAGLQLCKALGVSRIVGVCSKKNEEFCRQHGATEIIDYTNSSELETFYSENNGKIDCVLDAASSQSVNYLEKSLDLLRKDDNNKVVGVFTALNGSGSQWTRAIWGMEKDNQHIIMMNPNTADLERVGALLRKIGAKPPLNEMSFDNEGLKLAFDLLKSHRTKGKIVFGLSDV